MPDGMVISMKLWFVRRGEGMSACGRSNNKNEHSHRGSTLDYLSDGGKTTNEFGRMDLFLCINV